MQSVYNIFKELKNELPKNGDSFAVAILPAIKNHRLGITEAGQPIFFVRCDENIMAKPLDTNLEYISVQFGRQCQLISEKGKIEDGTYTLITLKSNIGYLEEYFLKIVYVLIKNISDKPLLKDLNLEIEKLTHLFTKFSKPALKTIQGLWAELLIIEKSKDPDYLVKSWHNSSYDKYDFNDGIDKIEVKSTSKNRRIHNFSLEQLCPNSSSKLIICSVFTVETGIGISVLDLVESIGSKLKDKKLFFRLNEMIASTLGKDFEKSLDIFFDYKLAVDSIRHYDSLDIPTINKDHIPSTVSSVRFDCDLTDVISLSNEMVKSKLHKTLF